MTSLPTTFPDTGSRPFTVIVTGANSGLGFATCTRLIEQSLKSTNTRLLLIPTTRSASKGKSTKDQLSQHARDFQLKLEKDACSSGLCPIPMDPIKTNRIMIEPVQLHLNNLLSVSKFVSKELQAIGVSTAVDAVIMNAGIGCWTGVAWFQCIYEILFVSWISAMTYPTFKLAARGLETKRQTKDAGSDEPKLGEVFCSNVFGHYLLGHYLAPLLSNSFPGFGRLIWISSLEAYEDTFTIKDFQGLLSTKPYESTKRLTDVLALSSNLPSVKPFVSRYLQSTTSERSTNNLTPEIFVCHPGICGTSIFPLIFPLPHLMVFAFWVARMLGSPWQTVSPYTAATSPVWLATSSPETLAASAQAGRAVSTSQSIGTADKSQFTDKDGVAYKCKWGSACNRAGEELILPTEVEGWAVRGVAGERPDLKASCRPDLKAPQTAEERDKFESVAVQGWREMERLRLEWEGILAESSTS